MSTDSLRVLGIAGSLRKASFNRALLRSAVEIAVETQLPIAFDIAEIGDLPLYDEDLRGSGFPAPVERFRHQVAAAEAILFVTPEYNYSVSGVLKNAIDWASRSEGKEPQPFAGKPCAIMGVSGGPSGTMRAQYHLRQIVVFLDMHALNKPEVFGGEGKLVDEPTRQVVGQLLGAFVPFARRINAK
jgi:chromate reductase